MNESTKSDELRSKERQKDQPHRVTLIRASALESEMSTENGLSPNVGTSTAPRVVLHLPKPTVDPDNDDEELSEDGYGEGEVEIEDEYEDEPSGEESE